MPVSIREQVLDAITTAVEGEYGVPAAELERDLPVCIVQEGDDTSTQTEYGSDSIEMIVVVARAAAATDTDKGAMRAQAHEMLASIRSEMFTDETFGGLVDGIEYIGGGIQTELAKICFAEAQFNVRYQTVRGDPYTQV
jgi:hypothetical protein